MNIVLILIFLCFGWYHILYFIWLWWFQAFMKAGFGKSESNFLMLIHTSLLLLGLWTRYTTQMLMSCEQLIPWHKPNFYQKLFGPGILLTAIWQIWSYENFSLDSKNTLACYCFLRSIKQRQYDYFADFFHCRQSS